MVKDVLAGLSDQGDGDGDSFAQEDEDEEADHEDGDGDDEEHQPGCLQLCQVVELQGEGHLHVWHVTHGGVAALS